MFKASDKYRVQAQYANPEAVVRHSGKLHRYIDVYASHTLSEAKAWMKTYTTDRAVRIIKIATPSEGALRLDIQAYKGRRFNIMVEANQKAQESVNASL